MAAANTIDRPARVARRRTGAVVADNPFLPVAGGYPRCVVDCDLRAYLRQRACAHNQNGSMECTH